MGNEHLFDATAAGVYIGGCNKPIAYQTLARWRSKGGGPRFIKVGRLARYSRADLDAWLTERQRAVAGVAVAASSGAI